jgi:branched-chain amino acid transport system substrate-binding protein
MTDKNKSILSSSAFVVYIFLFLGMLFSETNAEEKIKIGVAVPLTGVAAAYGTDIKNALEFANKRIANSEYELIVEDDHCIDKDAVGVAHKLVSVDKVKYVLGFGCSGTVLAAAPVYDSAKVVIIASGTGAPAITFAGDYIFRTKPTLNFAGQLLAEDMAKKFKKVAILSEETAYCLGIADAVTKSAAKLNLEVINETYLSGTDDFRTILLRLKSKGVEGIFLNTQAEPGMVDLYQQFKTLNWNAQVYGTFTPGSAAFLSALGEKADGIIYADMAFNDLMLDENGRKLVSDFEKEYGKIKSAEHFLSLSLISFSTLNEAIQSKKDVKEYLYNTKFNNLVVGGYSFDKNGDVVSDKLNYVLKTVKNGGVVTYSN